MECRLVLNNRSTVDIPNDALCGPLQQQLKYYKFRRVQTKAGKAVFYLFFRKEAETYYALRTAASPPSEMHYRPVPTKTIVDMIRYNYTRYFDRFSNKDIFKLFVRRVSEQIAVQRLKIPEVHDRICTLHHWWWMNQEYVINNSQNVQKLLDIFFK
ncbi:unnamed protein product [Rotaria magnacalcarata]|uniref:Uncharacterized protein n=2 Tax=Rotaria magnacalcarata TaxID=392030 RepID=A0A816ZJ74_9BILA|nr:unnamed protein product [Rotaria magnacalcarata]